MTMHWGYPGVRYRMQWVKGIVTVCLVSVRGGRDDIPFFILKAGDPKYLPLSL